MPTIIFSPSAQLSTVDGFPKECERTVKGALHIRPGATCIVTDGELAHLKTLGVAFVVTGARKSTQAPQTAVAQPSVPPPAPSSKPKVSGGKEPFAPAVARAQSDEPK